MEDESPGASPEGAGGAEEGQNVESNVSQPEVPAVPSSTSLLCPSDGGINSESAGESARTGSDTVADATNEVPARAKSRRKQGLPPPPRVSLTK